MKISMHQKATSSGSSSLLNRLPARGRAPTIEDGRGRRPIAPVVDVPPQPAYAPPWRAERTAQEARLRALEQSYLDACAVGGQIKERLAALGERIEKGRGMIAARLSASDRPLPDDWQALLDRLEVEYAELSIDAKNQADLVDWSFQMFDAELRDYERRVDRGPAE